MKRNELIKAEQTKRSGAYATRRITGRRFLAVGLAMAAVSALMLSGCVTSGGSTNGTTVVTQSDAGLIGNGISVSGSASVYVTPDRAEVLFGIVTEGKDAGSVKDQNTADYDQVIDFLKAQGYAEESIATTGLGLSPIYDWSGNTRELAGYSMETDILVSDIAIDELGALLDSAVDSGINSIQSVSYKCSNYDEAYNEALTAAVADAKAKAEVLAQAGGVELGSVTNMTEYAQDTSMRYAKNYGAGVSADQASGSMNIQPGQQEIEANVSVVYGIN